MDAPLTRRRETLEAFVKSAERDDLVLSRATRDVTEAKRWLSDAGHGSTDGIVAKLLAEAYRPGERAMVKVKRLRTADCVVGGFRYLGDRREVGSLLLGLYNDEGKLDHVGFTSTIANDDRAELTTTAGSAAPAAGFHRQGAGRPEPLEHRAQRAMGAAAPRARGRSPLRSRHRRPLPARHQVPALAARQIAEAMHVRSNGLKRRWTLPGPDRNMGIASSCMKSGSEPVNVANLQLEGLLMAVASINNLLVQQKLLSIDDIDTALRKAEAGLTGDQHLLGTMSLANRDAVCFPIRLLRLANIMQSETGVPPFSELARGVGQTKEPYNDQM